MVERDWVMTWSIALVEEGISCDMVVCHLECREEHVLCTHMICALAEL